MHVLRRMHSGPREVPSICATLSQACRQHQRNVIVLRCPTLAVHEEQVRTNFRTMRASDTHVHFVQGFFQHSLPALRDRFRTENRKLLALRGGDGDMYVQSADISGLTVQIAFSGNLSKNFHPSKFPNSIHFSKFPPSSFSAASKPNFASKY